jgi:hypothetical protein
MLIELRNVVAAVLLQLLQLGKMACEGVGAMEAVAMNRAPANWTPWGDIEKNRVGSNRDRGGVEVC